ncbi:MULTISPECIES: EAL domain-containing protein [Bacillus]|uniref:EAL domain-containing protein n=1 Tax=Bacillus TaxID=1386 RepID=UPI000BB724A0|nr:MULTISPECIES: EAL domain-containing protein [Bacillus]
MNCIDCGVPNLIETHGTLFVIFEKKDNMETARIPHSEYTYHSLNELTNFIEELVATLPETDSEKLLVKTLDMPSYEEVHIFHELLANQDLIRIMRDGSFKTFFQPIVDLQSEKNAIFAYECLLRPIKGGEFLPPYPLFEFARNANLHNFLDQKARESSIISSSQKLNEDVKVFINFLPSSIYNPEFCLRHTFQIVKKYNVSPENLVFEVVESEKIKDLGHLQNIFRTYKNSGMKVALDDVGAGYSTLEVLEALRPDYVKIDRDYISFCDKDVEKQMFLQNVMGISRRLNLKVLAEGIERKEELVFCRELGIHYAQGYYIGKPSEEPMKEEDLTI